MQASKLVTGHGAVRADLQHDLFTDDALSPRTVFSDNCVHVLGRAAAVNRVLSSDCR